MIIDKIADNPSKTNKIVSILSSALNSADPFDISKNLITRSGKHIEIKDVYGKSSSFDISKYKTILLLGIGKACAPIAKHIESILSDRLSMGYLIVKYGYKTNLKNLVIKEAGHPVPDKNGVIVTSEMIDLIKDADKNTLILFIVTGGGSSLLVNPENGIDLDDLKIFSRMILNSGFSIHEMNLLRTSISKIKGGGIAELAKPATIVSIIISDVPGNQLRSIASGPTISTSILYSECLNLLKNNQLYEKIPESIKKFYSKNINKKRETSAYNAYNILIGSNRICLQKARNQAKNLGYFSHILTESLSGPIDNCVEKFVNFVIDTNNFTKPFCLLSGGETEVNVKKNGKGGRNQHFSLLFAKRIMGIDTTNQIMFASLGTDGGDGKCDVAGAIVNKNTLKRTVTKEEIDRYLKKFDSYGFFKKYGGHIITGPTNTNFMDIQVLLIN